MKITSQQQSVYVTRLHLDGQNPRHEPSADEPSIISYLVRNEHVLPLAQDICARGLSPLERLAVIPHPTLDGHFVMVEGNRRLCAMKLLRDPAKAPAAERKAFKRLADQQPRLPRQLDVAVFDSRDDANSWIALKHGGLQGGVGTKNWNASQSSRFLESLSGVKKPNSLALAVLDYASDCGLITADQRAAIAITTVTRYLTNPVVRSALGLASASEFKIDVPEAEFRAVLGQFLADVVDGREVSSRSKSADRASYGRKLLSTGLSPSTRLDAPVTPVSSSPTQPKVPVATHDAVRPTLKNNRSPDLGAKVVRTGYAAQISDPTIKRVFDELRKIEAAEYPFAAACLLRLFMELICRGYADRVGIGGQGDLAPVIGRCAKHMEEKGGAKKEVFHIWRMLSSNPSHYLAPGSLSSYAHGGTTPVLSELRRGWDDLEPGFDLMLTTLQAPAASRKSQKS